LADGEEDVMPRKRTRGVRRNEQQWAEILRRFEASGLGSREFCRRDGVPLSSLQRWQRRLRSVPSGKFVEIVSSTPTSAAATSWSFEVSLPNGASLRFQA
jgi:hypothetical protein